MDPLLAVILLLTLALAAANGANDNAKGVATLAGAGVTHYGTALAWGTATTLAGSLLSFLFAERMTALFTRGIVATPPTPAFALAVLAGAGAWVAIATATRLPVSTIHAIVGALLGAGVQLAPGAIDWAGLLTGAALPLLLSVALSYGLSTALGAVPLRLPECVCVGAAAPAASAVGPTAMTAVGAAWAVATWPTAAATCRSSRRAAPVPGGT